MASLPWGHNLVLLHKLKDRATRLWYAGAAIEHGWSRAVLTVQIETKAHQRMGKAQTNFAQTLPPPQSDLAQQVLKDPYTFDFLTLGADARERELEQGLVEHIQKFLLELGVGFAFVGRQVHLEVAGEDYYLDLLFYHLKLRCFVVIDLKMEPFKPEFAGKMNFYLSAVDDQRRHAGDQPTIGLLLCKDKQQLTVEYTLRDPSKPIGGGGKKTPPRPSPPNNPARPPPPQRRKGKPPARPHTAPPPPHPNPTTPPRRRGPPARPGAGRGPAPRRSAARGENRSAEPEPRGWGGGGGGRRAAKPNPTPRPGGGASRRSAHATVARCFPAAANRDIYTLLKEGVQVSVPDPERGGQKSERVRVIDWDDPQANDFLLVSQMTITGPLYTCRPDLIGFVNGLPLVLIEFKKPGVSARAAFDENITSYKHPQNGVPALFRYNALIIASNGTESRVGSITADWERMAEWKRVEREDEPRRVSLEVMIRGVCEPGRLLDLVENFTLFSEHKSGLIKILAQNHQVLGVNNTMASMLEARKAGHGRAGVFWQTQGSGKSFSMVFFSQKVLRKITGNWTFVVVTGPQGTGRSDREDLQGDGSRHAARGRRVPCAKRLRVARTPARESSVRVYA